MLNFPVTPLRLMLVDDEYEISDVPNQFEQAARSEDPTCEVILCKKATDALEKLRELARRGEKVHFVAMDYMLGRGDIKPLDFLSSYLAQNPGGYWCWSSAFSHEAYPELLGSQANGLLHTRMLAGFDKSNPEGFGTALRELTSRLKGDLKKHTEEETEVVILTDRETLQIFEGSLVRKEGNRAFSNLDELVPGCEIFENAAIIHAPSLPGKATRFTDAIVTRQCMGRTSVADQSRLKWKAWVGRKYFEPITIFTANKFSKEFAPDNWLKYATLFNLNLTWLDAASENNWRGSILRTIDGKKWTELDDGVEAVKVAKQAGAVWSNIAPKNFIAQFRPWATAYRSLRATSFFQGIDDMSGELKECDEGLPLQAASGQTKMRVSPEAALYIDWGDRLYDVRNRVEVPIQPNADPRQTSPSLSDAPTVKSPDAAIPATLQNAVRSGKKNRAGGKPPAKGPTIKAKRR